ncbi:LysR family transcriptional regulator [Cognatiyoonia sp. IB215446]|uniref:LysR family transcriptional regulator n=1 Tax=Cognatiyoonia sp. IB215446 TaxID=3097355 RepID=UPI002A1226EA|nr:LysR family transcriptional regulator [Cognatiyoonia sp. IB215446]MDX8346527.1 LysR family transcriptional regulator [Cognatiyoonia sp. IB215446]
MQIELIVTFLDLCETRSFNKTAERLRITQSTVSGRIKALEAVIGRRLFQRSRAGTALTTEGLRFEPHARSLRHNWITALNATRDSGMAGVTMRIGLQHDLVSFEISRLIGAFRNTLPDTVFLFEADYSTQMCADLVAGMQDIAVLYSPQTHPDLHFEGLGEVSYVMISTQPDALQEMSRDRYILANYSPAFAYAHAALLPDFAQVSLSIGQNAAMVDLLTSLSGAGYVLRHSANALIAAGTCYPVANAPVISQSVFAGINARNRHRSVYRRMLRILMDHYAHDRRQVTGTP